MLVVDVVLEEIARPLLAIVRRGPLGAADGQTALRPRSRLYAGDDIGERALGQRRGLLIEPLPDRNRADLATHVVDDLCFEAHRRPRFRKENR
jgi:hypothetical protein